MMKKKVVHFLLSVAVLICYSFTFSTSESLNEGVFICKFNGKDFIIKGHKAQFRTITGGMKQLSLSNDKFEAFVFLDPSVGRIDLAKASNREAFVRYIEPGTDRVYKPIDGFIEINKLDFDNQVVSGTFEMVLVNREGPEKRITVSNGKFDNLSIVSISGR